MFRPQEQEVGPLLWSHFSSIRPDTVGADAAVTMILSLITHTHVVQVSDRRLTQLLADGSTAPYDDETNKATFFCDRAIFGYTGTAFVNGEKADQWLTIALQPTTTLRAAFDKLASEATSAFQKPAMRGQRLAVGCVGWSDDERLGLVPFYSIVSNFIENGKALPVPADRFSVAGQKLPADRPFMIWSLGQDLDHAVARRLVRDLSKVVKRGLSAAAGLRLLVAAMRVSARTNPTIGRGIMANCLPRSAVGADEILMLSGGPMDDAATFLYLPPTGGGFVVHGPNTVCGGSASLGFTFRHS